MKSDRHFPPLRHRRSRLFCHVPGACRHAVDAGEARSGRAGPGRMPRRFAGLAFMGGPMSVNDDLPWIPKVLQLIQDAVAKDVPVLGPLPGRAAHGQGAGRPGDAVRRSRRSAGERWRSRIRPGGGLVRCRIERRFWRVSMAWRDLQPAARCDASAVQPLVCQSGIRAGAAPRPSMPHRNERRAGAQLVRDRCARDRTQRQSGRAAGRGSS